MIISEFDIAEMMKTSKMDYIQARHHIESREIYQNIQILRKRQMAEDALAANSKLPY
jgi:hypothetical protein